MPESTSKPRKTGRVSNAILEAAARLRDEVLDPHIQSLADKHNVHFDAIYRAMGYGDPAAGHSANNWNLFSQIKRAEWKDIPANLGKKFNAKARAAYAEATAGLDADGKARFRLELLSKAKKASQGEGNARTSITDIINSMSMAVSIQESIFFYQYILYFLLKLASTC